MYTSHTSNVMRLMIYPKNPLDPNNTEWDVLMMSRCTYGDMICSCLLEVVLREIVSPRCKTELARKILSDHRYVDDLLAGAATEDLLREAMLEIELTLGKLGFAFKHIITNFGNYHPDGSSEDGNIASDHLTELIFHHVWDFRRDLLTNRPRFNTSKKSRGAYTGADLESIDIDKLNISK